MIASDDAPKNAAANGTEPLDLSNLQAVTAALRSVYLDPSAVTDAKLNEAAARGMLGRLGIGAKILDAKSATAKNGVPDIAKTEMLGEQIFYVRPGALGLGDPVRVPQGRVLGVQGHEAAVGVAPGRAAGVGVQPRSF